MRKKYTENEGKKEEKAKLKLNYSEKNGEKKCIYSIGNKKIEIKDESLIQKLKTIEEDMQNKLLEKINFELKESGLLEK